MHNTIETDGRSGTAWDRWLDTAEQTGKFLPAPQGCEGRAGV